VKLFLLLVRSSWLTGLLSVILGAASGMASLRLITLVHAALSEPPSQSVRLAGLFVMFCVVVLVTRIFSKILLVSLSQRTASRLRRELCSRIIAAPLVRLEQIGSHRLISSLTGDVGSITNALSGVPWVCANSMVLICGVIYLASLSVTLACFAVLVATFGVISYLAGNRWANRYLRAAREDQDELMKQYRAMMRGIKDLKANERRRSDFVQSVLYPTETTMRRNLTMGQRIQGFAQSWGRLMVFIGIGLLLFVWPQIQTVDAAELTGYTLTILFLTYPLDQIVGWLPDMNRASISLRKIEELGLLIDYPEERNCGAAPSSFRLIELREVTYQYESPDREAFSLGPISMTLRPGEVLFAAGGNGSGKTTLAKIVTGLYVPCTGDVVLDGLNVGDDQRTAYRQLFSTVFVEGSLFDRLLGVDHQRRGDELQRWLSLLGIESKVDTQSGLLETNEVSRGQHKRLALLVACMDDRPVFVFDEWAAEQDPGFKEVFYRRILPELKAKGKAVIAITHDDRYFFAADRVVKLVDGRMEKEALASAESSAAERKAA